MLSNSPKAGRQRQKEDFSYHPPMRSSWVDVSGCLGLFITSLCTLQPTSPSCRTCCLAWKSRRFASGCADDAKLSDVLRKLDEQSLSHLIRDHEAEYLEQTVAARNR
jgi:hypothetical protein